MRSVPATTRRLLLCPLLLAALLAPGCGDGVTAPMGGLDLPTKQGMIHGAQDGPARAFLGLPFAAPPVGDNRFRPPQPAPSFAGVRDATAYGKTCPQFNPTTGAYDEKTSEDCLTLNVWTPTAPSSPRPVMVWLHGGGFVLGSGSEDLYVGTNLAAAGDVVVVTVNYRLGALGFLAHPALAAEDPGHPSSGNYGLLDQQAALRWVQSNIAAFGGDPKNVTLFGESAGGISVCQQLVSPGAAGLFHRAIVESGPCVVLPAPTRATWEAQGEALAKALSCGGDAPALRTCLRVKSAREVAGALPRRTEIIFGEGYAWTPHQDGVVLPDSPLALLKAGRGARVPLLVGANRDEGTIFFALGAKVENEADARKALGAIMPAAQVDAVLNQYKLASYPTPKDAALQVMADAFACDARRLARLHSAHSPVFEYHFTRAFQWAIPNLGAFHSAELPFIFKNPYTFINLKDEEKPLSDAMQSYWTRFAAKGDPNGGAPTGGVAWPAYTSDGDQHLKLDLTIETGSGLRKSACDFWDTLLP
ncbi:MAG: carboxylesterase family protein [Myxococcales bacterium]|nr:carboxylesterase family protein [Myxococcales bacterium]